MRSIVFDSGPVISLTSNNMIWILDRLKESFGGEFIMPMSVRKELIDRPIETKKFRFEALEVLSYIRKGTFNLHKSRPEVKQLAQELLDLVNSCYSCGPNSITIIHYAEMEVIALALYLNAEAVVVDERMLRVIIEDPLSVEKTLSARYKAKIVLDKDRLRKFKEKVKGIQMIRSVELAIVAYEKGWLNDFLPASSEARHPDKTLLTAVLWALKLRGCAISQDEIDNIVKLES